jgi:predicted PurR-regulated permease PerM
MAITFAEMFLGLFLLKLIGVYDGSYIAIISFVTCIIDIIPVLGTGTVLIPWAVFNLVFGNFGVGIGLLVIYAVVTVIRQIIEPKLVANQAGLPAIVTIMAMFIGVKVFGTFGIILLPFTVIILKLLYDEGVLFSKKTLSNKSVNKDAKESK